MTTDENQKIELTYWKNQEKGTEGKEYTDPLFPPNKNSLLGLDSSGNPIDQEAYTNANGSKINSEKIEFLRASEIFKGSRYVVISDTIDMDDIVPGQLEDTYFLCSVQNLCRKKANIDKIFKTNIMNPDGYYELVLFIEGKPQIVIVDDYLPVDKDTKKLIYAQSKKNEIWIMLLEKAWAKVNGGYANIIGGNPGEALEFLTGFSSLSYDTEGKDGDDLNEYKIEVVKQLQISDKENSIISCQTTSKTDVSGVGLITGYTYNMLDFHQIQTSNGEKVYLIKLRNPWSQGEWNGDWSDKSPLWDDTAKKQVNFTDKVDGIFFMNDNDFFKYFTHIEICYILSGGKSITYTVDGEEKNTNGIVFNTAIEGDGFLSVSVIRKSWRVNRDIKNKLLPTHISICRYDPNATKRLKTFSEYNGNFESYMTCAMNVSVKKGNYLVYVYRDIDHAEFTPEGPLDIKISCSVEFKHAQMSYDYRDKGFPLLQNMILQAEFEENNYDPDQATDFDINSNQIRGNGIGHVIYYISNPGYFLSYTGSTKKVKNYIMLTPYLTGKTTSFNRIVSSGKYLVFLGLLKSTDTKYAFSCFSKAYTTNKEMEEVFESNDIDLTLYTNMNNNIKNPNVKEKVIQSLEKKTEKYYDVGNETVVTKSLEDLKKEYGDYIKFLDDVPGDENDSNLNWVVIKGQYVIYVGQMNKEGKREGKGLLINPMNIFAGVFKNDLPNGKGYSYNANKEKLYYYMYINGIRKGNKVTAEEEQKELEEQERLRQIELEKERERLRLEEEARQAELKRQEEERRKAEEARLAELKRIEEERLAEEARIAEEMRLAEEKAKKEEEERLRLEEEKRKELQRQAEEEAKRLEEEKRKAEEALKAEQERIAAEMKKLEEEKEEAARKKAEEELKKQQEEAERKAEEARKAAEKAKEEAEKKQKEAEEQAKKAAEEAKLKAQKEQEELEKKKKLAQEEAERKAAELKKKEEEQKKEEQRKAEEKRIAEEKAKEEAKKLEEQIQNSKNKIKLAAQAKNAKAKEEAQKKKQQQQQTTYQPTTNTTTNSKRIQHVAFPFEGELMELCASCGCKIF